MGTELWVWLGTQRVLAPGKQIVNGGSDLIAHHAEDRRVWIGKLIDDERKTGKLNKGARGRGKERRVGR